MLQRPEVGNTFGLHVDACANSVFGYSCAWKMYALENVTD